MHVLSFSNSPHRHDMHDMHDRHDMHDIQLPWSLVSVLLEMPQDANVLEDSPILVAETSRSRRVHVHVV